MISAEHASSTNSSDGAGRRSWETVFFQTGSIGIVLWGRDKLTEDSGVDDADVGSFGGIELAHNVRLPADVDAGVMAAADAGATVTRPPADTFYGGYVRCFTDPDGRVWEIAYNPGFPLDHDGAITIPNFGVDG